MAKPRQPPLKPQPVIRLPLAHLGSQTTRHVCKQTLNELFAGRDLNHQGVPFIFIFINVQTTLLPESVSDSSQLYTQSCKQHLSNTDMSIADGS
jgi:hypothetical protein